MHRLAAPGNGVKLRLDLHRTSKNGYYYAIQNTFEVSGEADGFRINVACYAGTAGDALTRHKGMKFSTKYRDNDIYADDNFAKRWEGAWWYEACYKSYLNGRHLAATGADDITKQGWRQGRARGIAPVGAC